MSKKKDKKIADPSEKEMADMNSGASSGKRGKNTG